VIRSSPISAGGIGIGQETGELDKMFGRIADFYEDQQRDNALWWDSPQLDSAGAVSAQSGRVFA
jgi:hypothetical protein